MTRLYNRLRKCDAVVEHMHGLGLEPRKDGVYYAGNKLYVVGWLIGQGVNGRGYELCFYIDSDDALGRITLYLPTTGDISVDETKTIWKPLTTNRNS